jgi:hypothetical protein
MKTAPVTRFFVVIHTVTRESSGLEHALEQTAIAMDNGADGIFIIPDYEKGSEIMATTEEQLIYAKALRKKFPHYLIGINFLTMSMADIALDLYAVQPNLLQTDGSSLKGIEKGNLPVTECFCGLAFKYSSKEKLRGERLREHCLAVASMCDVPTTSGSGTGYAADIEKIKEIVSYLPKGKRLGLASGVTMENVESYLEAGVTDFLVATSLRDHVDKHGRDILDPSEIAGMAEKIHAFA